MVCLTRHRSYHGANLTFTQRIAILVLLSFIMQGTLRAQSCTTPIQNNSFVIKPAICNGTVAFLQGSAPAGGNGTYTYRWEMSTNNCGDNGFVPIPGATNKDLHVLSQADDDICYRRVVISGGCSSVSNKTKVEGQNRTNPSPPAVTVVQPTCITPGSITITNPAPATGFTYSINGTTYTNTTGIFTNLTAGTYNVSARHVSGCTSPVRLVTLQSSTAPSGTVSPSTATICTGQSQTLTATGGSSYRWYRNGSLISGATANTYSATQAGTYRAEIINGICTTLSNNSTVTVAPSPSGSIAPSSASICQGDSVVLSTSGGVSYQWYKNGTLISGATTSSYKTKESGTYSADIISNNGCTAKASNNAVIAVSTPPAGNITPANATICTGGSVTLTANGGNSYQWYRNGVIINGATAAAYNANQTGTYTADIVGNNGCRATASNNAVVTNGTSPTGTISPASGQLCGSNASVVLTVTGGSSYQWYRNNTPINGATSATFTATTAGTYTVDIINGNCTGKASNSVVISAGNGPSGSITPSAASICPGGSQLLTASGGTSYQWKKDGVVIAGATGATYSATQPGTYTVTIYNGSCNALASNAASISLSEPPTGTITPADATICAGNSQVLTATGGVSYQWYKDNTPINGATNAIYTATQNGTYTVDIVGSNGCKDKASNASVISVSTSPAGSISPTSGSICANGLLLLTAAGGASYQWYKNGVPIAGAVGPTYLATTTGTYTTDIFNVHGCKVSATNSVVITQGAVPTGTISPASATICSGNGTTLTATGGNAYQWFLNGSPITGATAATYQAVQTGTYSVTIFNGGCSGTANNVSVVSASTPLSFSVNVVQPTCAKPSGTITITNPTGGSGNGYLYSKDDGNNYQTSTVFTDLPVGTYQVVVKDGAGCRSNINTIAIHPSSTNLQASVSTTSITCTQTSGSATVIASGGTTPYQYSLNGGAMQNGNVFNNLSAGTHKIVVKDGSGCVVEISFSIQASNSTLSASAATTNPDCGQQSGSVQITATGGSPGYTYSLNNGTFQTSNTFSNVALGSHKVRVKDQAGCLFDVTFEIKQTTSNPTLTITNPAAICPNATVDLRLPAITSGSDPSLTYTYWRDSNATNALANPGAVTTGTYYIKATNASGCFTIKPVIVSNRSTNGGSISVNGPSSPCNGQVVTLKASSGQAYQWYRNDTLIVGATANFYTPTVDGVYSVLIDDGTCSIPASNKVKLAFRDCGVTTDPKVFVPTAFTPNRNGANDVLRPILYNIAELLYFKVYNRWGQLIFQTNKMGEGWNGLLNGLYQPTETYSWILECKDKSGNVVKQSGKSLLIR